MKNLLLTSSLLLAALPAFATDIGPSTSTVVLPLGSDTF